MIDDVRPHHVEELARRMRDIDRFEVRSTYGWSALEAAQESVRLSTWSMAGVYAGRLGFIAGVADLAPRVGSPWLLGTCTIDSNKRQFQADTRVLLEKMFEGRDLLVNYIAADNVRAIRWGERLGFKFGPPVPHGKEQDLFRRFTMRVEDLK